MLKRPLPLLLCAAAALSCTDAAGPNGPDGLVILFTVHGPTAVSQAETTALGAAFDIVDEYIVDIVDDATDEAIANDTITITSGLAVHVLDVEVPESALGRTVRITLIAYHEGMELYRSVSVTTLSDTGTTTVDLEVRYTGPGIRGTLIDYLGDLLGGETVSLYQGQAMVDAVQTEPDGTYLFVDVPVGVYEVQPTGLSYAYVCPAFREVEVQFVDDAIVADFVASEVFCGTSVLVLSGGDFDDTQAAVTSLTSLGSDITVSSFFFVNQTPGIDVLSQYDVVLLFMNGLFNESVTLGSEIAEYVNLGGNLVLGSFYWQGRSDSSLGSPGWGDLETIDPFASTGGATYQPGVMDGASVVAHPLTVGVASVTSTGFWGGVSARTGTTVVASWVGGTPMIAYRTLPSGQRIVGVSLFPASGVSATGDWETLFYNAVEWAGEAGGPVPE